jgi:hypothetical protein
VLENLIYEEGMSLSERNEVLAEAEVIEMSETGGTGGAKEKETCRITGWAYVDRDILEPSTKVGFVRQEVSNVAKL